MSSNNYNMNETDMLVPIYTDYVTKNQYYNLPTIPIDGIIYHDVGVGSNKSAETWQSRWNRPECKNSVHAIVTLDKTCIMLPCFEKKGYARKAAGCGKGKNGSYNNSRIQFECACSKELVYNGPSFTIKDKTKAIEEETKLRDNSIDLMARICLAHGLLPTGFTKDGAPVILDHRSAHVDFSMASGHADISGDKIKGLPEVYPSLDFIRQKVKERMEAIKAEEELSKMTQAEFDKYLLNASPTTIDKLFQSYFDRLSKKSASSYAKEDLAWAKDNGLLVGSQGNQMPQMFTKREDMCAVLHRYHEEFVQTKRQ